MERIDGSPQWWNYGGREMRVDAEASNDRMIVLRGEKAWVKILFLEKEATPFCFRIEWELTHWSGTTSGNVKMMAESLMVAFALAPRKPYPPMNPTLDLMCKADAGEFGCFVRKDRWLNIPNPGTGHHCDPNLSVFVTDEVQEAVQKILSHAPTVPVS